MNLRVGIVGGGVMGLSAAWALARVGAGVTVFEQGPIPNPLGSSVDHHRLIRYPYGAAHSFSRMVAEAYGAWELLWRDLGERHYVETGTLTVGGPDDPWSAASAAVMDRLSLPYEWLGAEALEARFPLLDAGGREAGGRQALFTPSGGALLAQDIVANLARHLAEGGVAMHAKTQVAAVDPERATVSLTNGATERFDRVVVAAGPWLTRLLPGYGARVRPARQTLVYLAPPPGDRDRWAAMPMVLDIDVQRGFYLVPPVGTGQAAGLKVGDHRFGPTGDPDRDRTPSPGEIDAILSLARPWLRDPDAYAVASAKTCFYTVEPQERLLVETVGRAVVMSPCSGHGFKFAALLGLRVADMMAVGDRALASSGPVL
jgi:glycine/D-amino acid oxidase-like deaminating enzyme